jgi:hypothetical protein
MPERNLPPADAVSRRAKGWRRYRTGELNGLQCRLSLAASHYWRGRPEDMTANRPRDSADDWLAP